MPTWRAYLALTARRAGRRARPGRWSDLAGRAPSHVPARRLRRTLGADGSASTIYTDTGPLLQALFAALALVTVAASLRRSGRAAWAGWLLVAGYVAADLALLLLGRGSYLLLIARDPRYVTDALPVVAIGVCAAFCGGTAQSEPGRGASGAGLGATSVLACWSRRWWPAGSDDDGSAGSGAPARRVGEVRQDPDIALAGRARVPPSLDHTGPGRCERPP